MYLHTLPAYLKINVHGKDYLLVHAGLGEFRPDKPLDEYELYELIWERPKLTDRYFDNITTVFGHTPTCSYGREYEGKIIVTDTWINTDAGAGYGYHPILLRLDDMKQFQ